MIKTTTTILGFLLLCVHSFCDAPDTSIFTSDFEKKIFLKLDNREPVDSIDLFTALNFKALSANEKVIGYFEKIYEKVRNLPMNKKLKTVYQEVHNEFFSKYTEEAFFNDIFINGNYNCVTATALYALFFDKLGIDYQIKETPDHVYLIADPKNTAMLIESTLPGEKIVQYDERLKIQYVEFLYNNKLISESEFRNISISELFEKHYLNDKTISLKQLAAIQYYNKGIFEYQKKNYGDALKDFEKAKLLNADEMISYMLNNTLINLLELENQLKSYSGRILAKYIAVNDSNTLGLEIAKDYFGTVSTELVINKPNASAYQKYFRDFSNNISGSDISEFTRTYYSFRGYHLAINYEYPPALANLKIAYDLNPENVLTRQLVIECIFKYVADDLDKVWANDSLNSYLRKFSFLRGDKSMVDLVGSSYFMPVAHILYDDDYETATRLLKGFEAFLKEYPDNRLDDNIAASIYQQFGYFHMKLKQYDKAEYFLRKGIRQFPEADFLKDQLRSIKWMTGGSYEYPELMDDTNPMKKYLMALAIAKDNLEATNTNTAQFLENKWNDSTGTGNMDLTIMAGNKVIYNSSIQGIWSYNPEKGILNMTLGQKKEKVYIIITQLLPDRLKGVLYSGTDYRNSKEILLKPVSD